MDIHPQKHKKIIMYTSDKLLLIRSKMEIQGIQACIIPYGDQHLSEYPAEHWKTRDWISNFTGSAGTLVITAHEAGLWTDSRYFLQAENQLDTSCVQLFKEGMPDVPEYAEWLTHVLEPGDKVGINGVLFSVSQVRKLVKTLRDHRIQSDLKFTLAEECWDTRPPIPEDSVFEHDDKFCGQTRAAKLEAIRKYMRKQKISHYIVSMLDEVAWVLNLRGTDVPYNPVFHSFLIIEHDQVRFFIDPHKLTAGIARKLDADNIKVSLYDDFYQHVQDITSEARFLIDPDRTNYTIFATMSQAAQKIEERSIVSILKARKTNKEIENFRTTLINDGVAMVQFLKWLEDHVGSGSITELSAAKQLKSFRAKLPGFSGESFSTISGYKGHGAIVHYSVNRESDITLQPEGLFLIDSGGQYPGGTTDITRTVALGDFPEQAAVDYTLVLQGHIALATAIFPNGTRGVHLDPLARKAMWKFGINYGHGTGHGIGYFLNVHEGPQSIRPQDNGVELEPGMITSNEPGIYRTGEYGIRIENLILCKEKIETEFGLFMEFETLSLCPIDTKMVKKELLSSDETEWLNSYHKMVYDKLAPMLDEEHKTWLKNKTTAI